MPELNASRLWEVLQVHIWEKPRGGYAHVYTGNARGPAARQHLHRRIWLGRLWGGGGGLGSLWPEFGAKLWGLRAPPLRGRLHYPSRQESGLPLAWGALHLPCPAKTPSPLQHPFPTPPCLHSGSTCKGEPVTLSSWPLPPTSRPSSRGETPRQSS